MNIFREFLPSRGHNIGISDWVSDRYVSVHADGHQVKDGGGAGPDINRQPNEAEMLPKNPTVHNFINC